MEIVIGASPVRPVGKSGTGEHGGVIEAKILGVRNSRNRQGYPPMGRREKRKWKESQDPDNSCVLTLLVPHKYKIPKDLDSGNYKAFLRFVKHQR